MNSERYFSIYGLTESEDFLGYRSYEFTDLIQHLMVLEDVPTAVLPRLIKSIYNMKSYGFSAIFPIQTCYSCCGAVAQSLSASNLWKGLNLKKAYCEEDSENIMIATAESVEGCVTVCGNGVETEDLFDNFQRRILIESRVKDFDFFHATGTTIGMGFTGVSLKFRQFLESSGEVLGIRFQPIKIASDLT